MSCCYHLPQCNLDFAFGHLFVIEKTPAFVYHFVQFFDRQTECYMDGLYTDLPRRGMTCVGCMRTGFFRSHLKPKSPSSRAMGAVRIRHSIREFATQPVILRILLGGKQKWLPLNFGFNDVMRTGPIAVSIACRLCTYRGSDP